MTNKTIHIAIDGNEANIKNRVGSNVYAFEIIKQIEQISRENKDLKFTILLSNPALNHFPEARNNWQYKVIGPKKLWTQWGLPIHLFLNKKNYDVFFTPSHYAPRVSSIPYISSVMDLAYLDFPEQFKKEDLLQLTQWTKYSVDNAKKIIAISNFTKEKIIEKYHKKSQDIVVAYPDIVLEKEASKNEFKKYLKEHKITQPYFLYLGTLQPRKNLIKMIEAFEIFSRSQASQQLKIKSKYNKLNQKSNNIQPQLVIAGKIGWMAEEIISRVNASSLKKYIILTGFVPDEMKKPLYKNADASILIGIYEGFGIPPLESLTVGTIPIVSHSSSLPEVVGDAGIQVNPNNIQSIARGFNDVWNMTNNKKAFYQRKAKEQVKKFSWHNSAQIILNSLIETAQEFKSKEY
jgi:glycosyltransferase involved in cell wall biosynthesis